MSESAASPFDGTDPVFLSYRQADGTTITSELTWLLRAAGVPVWRDVDDLPPGDTPTRLREAISDGLSGAVLVITRGVADSKIVKKLESVELIELHNSTPDFALAIVNDVTTDEGRLDYGAPDRLLENLSDGLAGVDQNGTDRQELRKTVRALVWHRIANQRRRVAAEDGVMTLSLQSRNTPQVYDRTGASLDVRLRPSTHERLPSPEGLQDLQDTIGLLPDAVTRSGAKTVRITGGAQLSIALAIGAALPAVRVGLIEVQDLRGDWWLEGTRPQVSSTLMSVFKTDKAAKRPSGRPQVALYVDLIPAPSDDAFERFVEEMDGKLAAWEHLRSRQDEFLDPASANAIAHEIAHRARLLSNGNGNGNVHLLLRVPFPIAVLIGRLTNTLKIRAYEWDNSDQPDAADFRARFVPTLDLVPTHPAGVISAVLLPSTTTEAELGRQT
jgi:hypothetical protein